jgi:hypothetical protein
MQTSFQDTALLQETTAASILSVLVPLDPLYPCRVPLASNVPCNWNAYVNILSGGSGRCGGGGGGGLMRRRYLYIICQQLLLDAGKCLGLTLSVLPA